MLGQASHLLDADEALEALPVILGVVIRKDVGNGANPPDTLGLRKQSLHQGRLARQLVAKRVLAKTRGATVSLGPIELCDDIKSRLFVQELDIGLTGGGVDALNDDVDGLFSIIQDPGVAAHDGQDLVATSVLRNLNARNESANTHRPPMEGVG